MRTLRRTEREGLARARSWAVVLAAVLMAAFFVLPVAALAWRAAGLRGDWSVVSGSLGPALLLSLGTTSVAAVVVVLFGTPLAYFLARREFPFKKLLTVFVELPIVMPPVVAGLALLAAFGRRGLVGEALAVWGVGIPFTALAVVLAQVFVSAPFYVRAAQSRFASLPREIEDAAEVDGASRWEIFWLVMLPQSLPALLNGLILSWARALGEFGATILFAGNLPGRTQTMPLLVYGALERDLNVTYWTALILLGLAALAFTAARRMAGMSEERDEAA